MLKTPSLKVYLPFENSIKDTSGNNYNGTASTTSFVTEKIGKGLSLGSSNNVINSPFYKFTEYTACCWVYLKSNFNSTLSGMFTSSYDAFNSNSMIIGGIYSTTNKIFVSSFSSSYNLNSTQSNANISLNTWYHITLSATQNGVATLYINGTLDKTFQAGNSSVPSNNVYCVGDLRAARGLYFDGNIDECLFYNKVLPQSDIKRIMMGLHPLNG